MQPPIPDRRGGYFFKGSLRCQCYSNTVPSCSEWYIPASLIEADQQSSVFLVSDEDNVIAGKDTVSHGTSLSAAFNYDYHLTVLVFFLLTNAFLTLLIFGRTFHFGFSQKYIHTCSYIVWPYEIEMHSCEFGSVCVCV